MVDLLPGFSLALASLADTGLQVWNAASLNTTDKQRQWMRDPDYDYGAGIVVGENGIIKEETDDGLVVTLVSLALLQLPALSLVAASLASCRKLGPTAAAAKRVLLSLLLLIIPFPLLECAVYLGIAGFLSFLPLARERCLQARLSLGCFLQLVLQAVLLLGYSRTALQPAQLLSILSSCVVIRKFWTALVKEKSDEPKAINKFVVEHIKSGLFYLPLCIVSIASNVGLLILVILLCDVHAIFFVVISLLGNLVLAVFPPRELAAWVESKLSLQYRFGQDTDDCPAEGCNLLLAAQTAWANLFLPFRPLGSSSHLASLVMLSLQVFRSLGNIITIIALIVFVSEPNSDDQYKLDLRDGFNDYDYYQDDNDKDYFRLTLVYIFISLICISMLNVLTVVVYSYKIDSDDQDAENDIEKIPMMTPIIKNTEKAEKKLNTTDPQDETQMTILIEDDKKDVHSNKETEPLLNHAIDRTDINEPINADDSQKESEPENDETAQGSLEGSLKTISTSNINLPFTKKPSDGIELDETETSQEVEKTDEVENENLRQEDLIDAINRAAVVEQSKKAGPEPVDLLEPGGGGEVEHSSPPRPLFNRLTSADGSLAVQDKDLHFVGKDANLNDEQIKNLKDTVNNLLESGSVDKDNFKDVIGMCYPMVDLEKLENDIYQKFDEDKTGHIEVRKFLLIIYALSSGTAEEKLRMIFKLVDANDDEVIVLEEYKIVARDIFVLANETKLSEANELQLRLVMKSWDEMDANKDGKVVLEDFILACTESKFIVLTYIENFARDYREKYRKPSVALLKNNVEN